jgi:hypothetical protein
MRKMWMPNGLVVGFGCCQRHNGPEFLFLEFFLFNSGIFSFILLGILVIPLRTYVQERYLCKGTFKLQCQQVFGPYLQKLETFADTSRSASNA